LSTYPSNVKTTDSSSDMYLFAGPSNDTPVEATPSHGQHTTSVQGGWLVCPLFILTPNIKDGLSLKIKNLHIHLYLWKIKTP